MIHLKSLQIFSLVACVCLGCSSDNEDLLHDTLRSPAELPVTGFEMQANGDCMTPVYELVFHNLSSEADSYHWDFGDGTSSTLRDPKKIYAKSESYKVTMTAFFGDRKQETSKEVYVERNSDGTGPTGTISFARTNETRLEIGFKIESAHSQYTLLFGDGTLVNSDSVAIDHIYPGLGRYGVHVIFRNDNGSGCADTVVDLTRP